jgi:hypothetical protein
MFMSRYRSTQQNYKYFENEDNAEVHVNNTIKPERYAIKCTLKFGNDRYISVQNVLSSCLKT